MNKINDLTGKKIFKLTVISRCDDYVSPKGKRLTRWLCKCDCGNEIKVTSVNLKKGHTKSCGCLKSIATIEKNKTHELSKTRVYHIWQDIKKRCYNKKSKCFKRYGGRGITMYKEWLENPKSFYDWSINNGYNENLSIDRINVNGNYEPSNCRWATLEEQANNKRTNRMIEYNGETHTMAEWAHLYNIKYKLLFSRLKKGWSIEKALLTKVYTHSEAGKMVHKH